MQSLKGDLGRLEVEGQSPDVDSLAAIYQRSPAYKDTAATSSRMVLSELGQMFAVSVMACAIWDGFDLLLEGCAHEETPSTITASLSYVETIILY